MSELFDRLPEEKRKLIIKLSLREFAYMSFADANTDKIVAAAGISKGSLFKYFGSKAELYLYLLEDCTRIAEQAVNERVVTGQSVDEIMKSAFMTRLIFCRQNPILSRFLIIAAKETAPQVYEQKQIIINKYLDISDRRLNVLIDRALEGADLRIERSTAKLSLTAWWLYMSMYFTDRYKEGPEKLKMNMDELESLVESFLDAFIHGIIK